jgi:hypothetical protein
MIMKRLGLAFLLAVAVLTVSGCSDGTPKI